MMGEKVSFHLKFDEKELIKGLIEVDALTATVEFNLHVITLCWWTLKKIFQQLLMSALCQLPNWKNSSSLTPSVHRKRWTWPLGYCLGRKRKESTCQDSPTSCRLALKIIRRYKSCDNLKLKYCDL
ncbi:hypothetical protein V8G54_023676, partial [Vigna mungo]